MGVISSGTRIGITMTSSKIRPSMRGIMPMRMTATNSDFDTYRHTHVIRFYRYSHTSSLSILYKAAISKYISFLIFIKT